MIIRPEKVFRRYDRCVQGGKLPSLKFLLNFFMLQSFNSNRSLARDYSEILSAIDDNRVMELDDQPLTMLSKIFTPRQS